MATELFVFYGCYDEEVNDWSLFIVAVRHYPFVQLGFCHPAWGTTQCDCCSRCKVQRNDPNEQSALSLGKLPPRSVVRGQGVLRDHTWRGQKYCTESSRRSAPVNHLSQRLTSPAATCRLQRLVTRLSRVETSFVLFVTLHWGQDESLVYSFFFLMKRGKHACASDAEVILMLSSR